jgi:uncharacterized membrane protein YuzA (DUF378 family)
VLGVLIEVFGFNLVAALCRVAGKRQIAFVVLGIGKNRLALTSVLPLRARLSARSLRLIHSHGFLLRMKTQPF